MKEFKLFGKTTVLVMDRGEFWTEWMKGKVLYKARSLGDLTEVAPPKPGTWPQEMPMPMHGFAVKEEDKGRGLWTVPYWEVTRRGKLTVQVQARNQV